MHYGWIVLKREGDTVLGHQIQQKAVLTNTPVVHASKMNTRLLADLSNTIENSSRHSTLLIDVIGYTNMNGGYRKTLP